MLVTPHQSTFGGTEASMTTDLQETAEMAYGSSTVYDIEGRRLGSRSPHRQGPVSKVEIAGIAPIVTGMEALR